MTLPRSAFWLASPLLGAPDCKRTLSPSFTIQNEQLLLLSQARIAIEAVDLFTQAIAPEPEATAAGQEAKQARAILSARAFVYEAANLRGLAVAIGRRFPKLQADAERAVADFDAALPHLMELRDSQAHMDERWAARARGRRIELERGSSDDPRNFELVFLSEVEGDRLRATAASGRHLSLRIAPSAVRPIDALPEAVFASIVES